MYPGGCTQESVPRVYPHPVVPGQMEPALAPWAGLYRLSELTLAPWAGLYRLSEHPGPLGGSLPAGPGSAETWGICLHSGHFSAIFGSILATFRPLLVKLRPVFARIAGEVITGPLDRSLTAPGAVRAASDPILANIGLNLSSFGQFYPLSGQISSILRTFGPYSRFRQVPHKQVN